MRSNLRLACTLLPCLLLGCGGGASKSDPSGPRINVTAVFSTTANTVYTVKPEWSPNGNQIAFEGQEAGSSGGWDVFIVNAAAGSTPTKVTNWSTGTWENGGKNPATTAGGTLVYWTGSIASDGLHHLMAAASGQVANAPAPTVLHTFSPTDVGAPAGSVSSPGAMSISGDGTKAICDYWLLDWSGGATPTATQFTGVTELVISREGTHVAYVKTSGDVAYRAIAGGAETVIGPGSTISWASSGRLGFAVTGGYKVYATATGTSTTYPSSLHLQNAVLSWDASKIAFRTFGGANTGISVGVLVAN